MKYVLNKKDIEEACSLSVLIGMGYYNIVRIISAKFPKSTDVDCSVLFNEENNSVEIEVFPKEITIKTPENNEVKKQEKPHKMTQLERTLIGTNIVSIIVLALLAF